MREDTCNTTDQRCQTRAVYVQKFACWEVFDGLIELNEGVNKLIASIQTLQGM